MKSNENLMVGDWVKFKGSDLYHQVKVVSNKSIKFDNQKWFAKSSVEPIPLTQEILEKNGFVNDRGIYCWRDENKQITYFSKENNRPYCTYSFVNIESGCIVVNELPIEYVHELQHTLRLCGIKKEEIVL